MDNKAKANSFLADLGIDDELMDEINEANKAEQESPKVQYIVYFKGDKPDTVWEYHHEPDDGVPYGRLYGFWDEDPEKKESRSFKEHKSNNLKLMDFDTFMDRVPPNRDCTKIYDSEADFLLELI
jgi:hypothetical protein